MAKSATETAMPSAPVKTVGKFSFTVQRGVEIPAAAPRAPSANELPFKEIFPTMAHNDHLYVPTSFWTSAKAEGGRGVATEKATIAYQKEKLRASFSDWRKREPEDRAKLRLVVYPRKKGEDIPVGDGKTYQPAPEDGISIFLVDTSKN